MKSMYPSMQLHYQSYWTTPSTLIAECISARQLIMQADWDFRLYNILCMYLFRHASGMLITVYCACLHWQLTQSRTMQPHDRRSRDDERTIASSTILVKQMIQSILSLLAFPRRGAWSTLHKLIRYPSIAACSLYGRADIDSCWNKVFNDCTRFMTVDL